MNRGENQMTKKRKESSDGTGYFFLEFFLEIVIFIPRIFSAFIRGLL